MEFIIPTTRDELMSRTGTNHYCVEDLLTVRQLPVALQAFKSTCKSNSKCVVEHFDTLFSLLCLHKDLDQNTREEAWTSLLKGCQTFCRSLETTLDESDLSREERFASLNALKMSCYLVCQFLEQLDSEAHRPNAVVAGKGRGKKSKPASDSMSMDWEFERQQGIQVLLSFIQLSITKLWDPPIAEEEFVSLISTCCYKLLENPSAAKVKDTVICIAHIIGHLIKRFNHGLGASLKMDQLLKHFEFLTSPLTQIVEILVKEHGCKSIVADIMREIGNADTKEAARDTTAAKAYALFLAELAEKMPAVVLPCLPLVVGLLDGESYTLRNGVLSMMGEILIKYLCKEELDDKLRATRDGLFEKLEDHIHDVNAFVRSKVLQIWLHVVTEKCLPLLRQESVMTLVVGRLNDKSSIVRKHAIQLVTALLKSNPFAAQLGIDDLQSNYEKEKALLEEMAPEPSASVSADSVSDKLKEEWSTLEKQLMEFLAAEDVFLPRDSTAASTLIGDDDALEGVLEKIVRFLQNGELREAVALMLASLDSFPDVPLFDAFGRKDASESFDESTEDSSGSKDNADKLASTLKEVFFLKGPVPSPTPDTSTTSNAGDDRMEAELVKQQTLVQYLRNSLTFARQVQQCIPVICQLLGSKNVTDVLEAVQFFVTSVEFGLSAGIVGLRRMMALVWSQEATVREAVVAAYRTLYLEPKEKNQRSVASSIVKNLASLVVGSNYGELTSLEALVSEFVKSGHIGHQVIKALWERFAMKSDAVSAQDARIAVNLLAMCAQAEPDIIKSNIEVLIQEGLGPRGEDDCLLAQGTFQALLKLSAAPKEKGKLAPEPFRLSSDHELANRIKTILVKGITDTASNYWIPMANQAVMVIYKLLESPDMVCAGLLREMGKVLLEICEAAKAEEGGDEAMKSSSVTCVLTRVLSFAGQVAFSQAVYMEVDVLTELKRRQAVSEESSRGGRRKSKGVTCNSKGKDAESELEEDMALAGASADDAEMEYIRKLCEQELLSTNSFLISLQPLLIAVCTNSAKFSDPDLQTAASLTLARFMLVSSQFCEPHLQLLFTILEKSSSSVIRSNLIISLGDLTFRFPNLIEPWTPHLYARLHDDSPLVRKTTLQVLTHLILNDMVKVKGQISELATCIVDHDEMISGLAKLFFHELAKKGNSLYNMPDIISRLSDPDIGVGEEDFQTIIKYIFSHIEKSKHCESLAEKLCHRFRATRTERQARDLSFCLLQLSYTEKGLSKLLENFACFADKLVDNDVYAHFCQILSKSKQFMRPEAKVTMEEFESKLEQAHTRGLEEGDVAIKASKASVVVGTRARGGKSKAAASKKKQMKKDDDEDDEEVDVHSPYKPRRGVRGQGKPAKPRYVIDSDDEDNDGDLFDLGKEGLDADDSFVTKPFGKRSKRGKVTLTPLQSPAS
ncbi:unnamed protein product [Candidula unifasciata]|uniref:Condensin complex subunit 1 n=1 Tax=Candidula unifasciata TaxID=100452 RepID=A0A8S3YR91_9EUPU|nr:unnamed protein product [Candidula unifasciata]